MLRTVDFHAVFGAEQKRQHEIDRDKDQNVIQHDFDLRELNLRKMQYPKREDQDENNDTGII